MSRTKDGNDVSSIQVRLNQEDTDKLDALVKRMGISRSAVFRMLLRQAADQEISAVNAFKR